jgi:hypothetical protein
LSGDPTLVTGADTDLSLSACPLRAFPWSPNLAGVPYPCVAPAPGHARIGEPPGGGGAEGGDPIPRPSLYTPLSEFLCSAWPFAFAGEPHGDDGTE